MNKNIIELLIRYQLDNYNNRHGGDSDFEQFGIKLVQAAYPKASVRQSSGSEAGGDGGRDGTAIINGEEYKIACSIDKNIKSHEFRIREGKNKCIIPSFSLNLYSIPKEKRYETDTIRMRPRGACPGGLQAGRRGDTIHDHGRGAGANGYHFRLGEQ